MTVHIELDRDEPAPARPQRWRLALVAGMVVLAAVATVLRPEDRPPAPLEVAASWTATVPGELGEALAARTVGGLVLVVAERGMLAYDRASGAEYWRRAFDTTASPWERVRLAEGVAVIDGGAFYEVVDLASGTTRFTIRPERPTRSAVVLTDLVVAFGCDGRGCVATATDLAGEELWRVEREAEPLLPEPVSARHQTVAVENPAPVVPEPLTGGFFMWRDGDGRTAVDLATGTELGSWITTSADLHIYGGQHLVDVDLRYIVEYLDPATGALRWTRATLSELGRTGPVTVVDGLFLDSAPPENRGSPGSYQLIDPATGDVPPTPTAAGRRIIAVGPGIAVGLDPVDAELTAVRTGDSFFWRASLRVADSHGFTTTGFLTGDGWLAVGDVRGGLWYVALATGEVGNVPGGVVLGLDGGALVSADSARHTVELRELDKRSRP